MQLAIIEHQIARDCIPESTVKYSSIAMYLQTNSVTVISVTLNSN
jgi:hypothetical protein